MYYYFRAVETLLTVFWREQGKEEGKGKEGLGGRKRDNEDGFWEGRRMIENGSEGYEWTDLARCSDWRL